MQDFFVETLLDDAYQDADLRIVYSMSASAKVSFTLKEKKSGRVCLESGVLACQQGDNEHRFRISRPELWDAEHPNLYVLQVNVQSADGGYSFEREIGFRKIEVKGDRMLVNGKQVKLRGACRHDIHPTLGRTSTPELDSLDAALFKRANMNFVRTSHYPPTESFLKYCDREGIYVECETAVCFVDTYRQKNYAPGKSQDDPEATAQYLGQLEEMVATSRSHASVLFWSIGNESVYGKNFQLSYDWLKNEDKTRPVIFSYPGLVEKGKTAFDLLSMHYPGCDGTLSQFNVSTRGFQEKENRLCLMSGRMFLATRIRPCRMIPISGDSGQSLWIKCGVICLRRRVAWEELSGVIPMKRLCCLFRRKEPLTGLSLPIPRSRKTLTATVSVTVNGES